MKRKDSLPILIWIVPLCCHNCSLRCLLLFSCFSYFILWEKWLNGKDVKWWMLGGTVGSGGWKAEIGYRNGEGEKLEERDTRDKLTEGAAVQSGEKDERWGGREGVTGREGAGEQRGIGFREKVEREARVKTREELEFFLTSMYPGKILLSQHVLFQLHPALHRCS